jgi:transcriptional regulator with XRE-family HTH domain
MAKFKRAEISVEASRRIREQLARLGREVAASRKRRRLTQAALGALVGLARSTVSALERGLGGGHTMDTWQRIGVAVDRPLQVSLARDVLEETSDAGHLAMQELVLRSAKRLGFRASFELPTRPSQPWHSADVGLRSDARRHLVLVECWNRIGDIGAGARSTNRKVAEAEQLAIAVGGDRPFTVRACWIVRATRVNRELVARYPEVFTSRFPGSSMGWVRALTNGDAPPPEPGLIWCTVDADRLFAWRRPGHSP